MRRPLRAIYRLCGAPALAMTLFVSTALAAPPSTLAPPPPSEPAVEYLDPPSVVRGRQNRLTVVGRNVGRPVGLWTSLPAGKFQVVAAQAAPADPNDEAKSGEAKSGESKRCDFQVDVAADCPLGLYGLRLATEDGLSNLQLLLVDDIGPQSAESIGTEADSSKASPLRKKFPVAWSGQLRPAAADRFWFEVEAGQRLSFDVVASRLGTDADPLVTIYDADGRKVVRRDNDPGLFFDCCFEHKFAAAGVYSVEVRDSRFLGAANWRYVLRVGAFPASRTVVPSTVVAGEAASLRFPEVEVEPQPWNPANRPPLGGMFFDWRRPGDNASNWAPLLVTDVRSVVENEPNADADTATSAGVAPVWLHGVIEAPGDVDQFLLECKPGDKLVCRAETRPLASAADVELTAIDPTGRELQRVDDLTLPGGVVEEATVTITAGKASVYRLQVREATDQGGPQFTYRVEVRPATPRIQLSSPVASLTVPQSSYQRLPLTVVRTDCPGPIRLSLQDAPPGMRLEPDEIPAGATQIDCRLSAGAETPLGVATFRIVAQTEAGDVTRTAIATVQPLVDRQLVNVDLIKYALRDNQRWLPASVTDRLALQVTPPIPFSLELPEPLVTLPRYRQAALTIATTRAAGFDSPIMFSASGGQLGEERQGRRQVFGRYPTATAERPTVAATFHSRSQAQEAKERIDLTATTRVGDRNVILVRSFTLDVRPAFSFSLTPPQATLAPGARATLRLTLERLPSFAGQVTIEPVAQAGLELPASVSFAEGQSEAEIELVVAPDVKPGKRRVRFAASGQVDAFLEEPRPTDWDLEIKLEKKP